MNSCKNTGLKLTPAAPAIAPLGTQQFVASDGTGPYIFSVVPGGVGGTIDPDTGLYTAPNLVGSDDILVTDAKLATAPATIAVGTPLAISPLTALVVPGANQQFQASGGIEPYVFSVADGGAGGTVDPDTGFYSAPGDTGFDVVQLTDASLDEVEAEVTIDLPLRLAPARTMIGRNQSLVFLGRGGTGPYSYAVVTGPGAIDPDSGEYVSDNDLGQATIQVTDSLGVTANAVVLVGDIMRFVCDIIQTEMQLASDRVWIWDQKIFKPQDSGPFVVVGITSCKPFGNTNKNAADDTELTGIQSINMRATLFIEIISRDTSALERKEEILMALNSNYSEQQQERNSFRVFPITPNFINLSEVDGAAIPYRFNLSVNVMYMVTKTQAVEYFDTFDPPEVTTEP